MAQTSEQLNRELPRAPRPAVMWQVKTMEGELTVTFPERETVTETEQEEIQPKND